VALTLFSEPVYPTDFVLYTFAVWVMLFAEQVPVSLGVVVPTNPEATVCMTVHTLVRTVRDSQDRT
jgi:hypothetical protein